jgi:hypothetical protein
VRHALAEACRAWEPRCALAFSPKVPEPGQRQSDGSVAEFELAVWADPVYRGDWPASVKERNPVGLMIITPELVRAPPGPRGSRATRLPRRERSA